MGSPRDINDLIGGKRKPIRLQFFLEPGLCVLGYAPSLDICNPVRKQSAKDLPAGVDIRIQKYGAYERLDGVGQNRVAVAPPTFELSAPKPECRTQLEIPGHRCQGITPHEQGPEPSELTLARVGIIQKQLFRNQKINNRVAEKLQTFVVSGTGTPMSKRAFEQSLILERIPEAARNLARNVIHGYGAA
jgi:hypothetical protein